jgi:hypothetical protein
MRIAKFVRPMAWLIVTICVCNVGLIPAATQEKSSGVSCSEMNYTVLPNPPTNPDELIIISPPNAAGPTLATFGLYIDDIGNIDVNSNSYGMTGFLDLQWCDPRLAFEGANTPKAYLNHIAQAKLESIWWPDVNFSNELHPREIEDEELTIAPDGTVDYREKFAVDLATIYDLSKFPFDSQHLIAEVESFEWTAAQLTLNVQTNVAGFSPDFSIPQWTITNVQENLATKQEIRDRAAFSEITIDITVQRDPGYYVTKVIIPLLTIVGISLFALWLSPTETKDRVELIFTGVLTSVAYQFVIADNLPKHVYNSLVDLFVAWSFAVMVLAIVETMSVSLLIRNDRLIQATSVDRVLRLGLPFIYIVGTILLILSFARR